jgi:hypothetical protein
MASQFDLQWVSRLLLSRSCDLGSVAVRRSARHIGGLYAWNFEKNGRELNVRVEEQVVSNSIGLRAN